MNCNVDSYIFCFFKVTHDKVRENYHNMFNNNYFLMKRILSIFLLIQFIVVFNSSAFAEMAVAQSPTLILSGVLDGDRDSMKVMKELRRGKTKLKYEDYNNYRLSADVSFKTLKQKTLFDELQFNIGENFHSSKEYTRFLFSGNNYTEQKNAKVNLLPDLQNLQDSNQPQDAITLSDYDELRIEYRDIIYDNPTEINYLLSLESEAESGSSQEKLFYLIHSAYDTDFFVEVGEEDTSKATWQQKDNLYLFKRFFDLERDNSWRYNQDGGRVVIQKRFNKTLPYHSAIDLALDADTKLEWLNLRLKTEDGDEIIVGLNSIPKQILKHDDDKLRVRLLLAELQRVHKQLILEEILIFLSGTVDEILENRPLHSIHWMAIEHEGETKDKISESSQSDQGLKEEGNDKKNLEVIFVHSQIEDMGYGNKRIQLDLTKELRQVNWNSKLVSMKLLLEPKLKNKLGGVEIRKVSLVSTYENKVPAIALQGREVLKRWGVEIDAIANNNESNVWPLIYKHSITHQKPTNIDPQGRWIDMEWKVGKEIIEGSYLYIGGKEIQDKVVFIQATPYSFSGESLGNWSLRLNESVQLNNFKGSHEKVDYIKFRVYIDPPSGKSQQTETEDIYTPKGNRLRITELALFGVDNLSFDKILDAPFPLKQETPLDLEIENKPPNIITSKAQNGTTIFFKLDEEPSHGDLLFNTMIDDKNRSEEDSLVVSYEVPGILPFINECWLEMTATGGKKEIQNKICLDGSSGKKSVPLPGWVEQIKWRAILPPINNMWSNSVEGKFYLSIKLLTTITTSKKQLVSQPILALDGNKLLPVGAKFDKYGGNLYFDLGYIKHSTYFEDIKHLEHPWLKVDKIIIDREEPFSIKEWQELNQGELIKGGDGSFWLQILKYLSIIFAIWWLIASGWFIKSFRALVALFLSLWNLPVEVLSRFNIEVSWRLTFWWWSIVTLSLYVGGVLLSDMQAENYYFTFGGIALVMSWRALVENCKPYVESRWPGLSKKVYSGSGTKYFSGFVVIIFGVAVMLMLKLDFIANQLAVIGYYLLVVGVVLEILDSRKDKPSINQKNRVDK